MVAVTTTRSITMNNKALHCDNKGGKNMTSATGKSIVQTEGPGLVQPIWTSKDASKSNAVENVLSHKTLEKKISIINIVMNKKPQGKQNDHKNINILPVSDRLQDLHTNLKNTTIPKDHSGISSESVKNDNDNVCNTVSLGGKVPSNNNVILSHDSSRHVTVSDQVVPASVSRMGECTEVFGNVKQSSSQNPKIVDCGVNGRLNQNNPETVMMGGSTNCEGKALLNRDINDVSKKMNTQLIDDALVTCICEENDAAVDKDKLMKDLNDGVDKYNLEDDSDHVSPDKGNLINPLATGFQNKLGYRKEHILEDSTLVQTDLPSPVQAAKQVIKTKSVNSVRRHRLEKNPSTEMTNDETSDEDIGIYAESFRYSNWVCIDQKDTLASKLPIQSSLQSSTSSAPIPVSSAVSSVGSTIDSCTDSTDDVSSDITDGVLSSSPALDDVFSDPLSQTSSDAKIIHKHLDYTPSSGSETELRHQYMTRRKCLIQRADSQQEYHRLSTRMYDQDRQVIIERITDSDDLGLHLLDCYPTFVTSVDPGSAAEKAGIREGQILVSVNGQNVLTTTHADIIKLIQSLKGSVQLGVANSDFQPVRDLQAAVMSGYMYKLGNSAFKMWKKRFFILRQDNCLYYYKNHQETDPLGAFPLAGYIISRHTETTREHCFKVEKFGGRTYYFSANNRDQMTAWVGSLTEASVRSKKRKESFLSVSSNNVGLPALHILKPECAGFLGKLSPSRTAWWRRYCVLKDACMYYYKDKSSFSAIGVIHLHGYTVDGENCKRKKFSFTLQPPEQKMKVFAFSADNETDKTRWMESLVHSIQQWVRMDTDLELIDQS